MRGQEVGVDELLGVRFLDPIERSKRAHVVTARRGTATARDGLERDPEFENAFGVFAGAVPPGRVEALGEVAR